jgi:hypothetical protein
MFQKIVPFRVMGARRASGLLAIPPANDNRINAGGAIAPFRSGRPILACHWRPTTGGGLECYWRIETAGGGAAEEPDGRWKIRRVCA